MMHEDIETVAERGDPRHYARRAGAGAGCYRRPLEIREGEIPADFIARIGEESHHQSHHCADTV